MTPRLVTFVHLLREHGLRVSVAESLDALHGVGQIGLQDRELLRLGLRTVLVKSPEDFAVFDTLFERFFTLPRRRKRRRGNQAESGQQPAGRQAASPPQGAHAPQQPAPRPLLPRPATPQPQQDSQPTHVSAVAPEAGLQELAELEAAWQEQCATSPDLRHAAALVPAVTPPQIRLDREFPPDELGNIYREVEELAKHLLTRRALRYRRRRHGHIDLRATIRQSLRSGREVPLPLAHRRRHLHKLRLLILCDVSGSVWQVSTFLLKLVQTLQAEFASVRSFLFVSSVVEVSALFQRMRFPEDLETLRHHPQLNLFGFSDFGRAFYQFYSDLLGDLSRDTLVLILGDARNNNFDPQAWTLGEIRQRCQRLLWLNPEPRRLWDTGDSVLAAYTPHCDHVLECWTLEHLSQAASLLLHR